MSPLSRRQIFNLVPVGCAGCLGLCAAQTTPPVRTLRAAENADMTWEQVFEFAYRQRQIPLLLKLADQIGRKPFVEMLQKAAVAATIERVSKVDLPADRRTLEMWKARHRAPLFEHALVSDIVKDEPAELEFHVTECLWAKIFRAAGAADIGYASICHPDFAAATAWNPKLKMTRTKTLMQGDDCCNHH